MGCRWEEKHERKWVGRNLLSGLHSTIPVHPTQIKFSRNLKKFSTAAEAGAAPGGWGEGNCVLIRLPDTLRRTDSLEGRKAGKMCRKRSFSAFLPSKSALCQATGYAGELQIANWGLRIANCGSPASSLKQFKLKTEMDGRGMGAKE